MVILIQKRIFYLGGVISSLLLALKLSLDLSIFSTYCVVPFIVSLISIPFYTYLRISSECPKIDSLSSNILMFCSSNLSLFLSLFFLTTALKTDDLLSASWYSIFISLYFSVFVYFFLIIFLIPGFLRSNMTIQAFCLVLWGFCLIISSILLPKWLEDSLGNVFKALLPLNIACFFSVSGHIYSLVEKRNGIDRESAFYTFLVTGLVLADVELWVALLVACGAYFVIDWVVVELEIKENYQELR